MSRWQFNQVLVLHGTESNDAQPRQVGSLQNHEMPLEGKEIDYGKCVERPLILQFLRTLESLESLESLHLRRPEGITSAMCSDCHIAQTGHETYNQRLCGCLHQVPEPHGTESNDVQPQQIGS